MVSFGRYELAALLPFFLYPVVLLALGDLPAGYLARKVAVVLPFAVMVGLFNPLFDRQVLLQLGPLDIRGGWLSCASIMRPRAADRRRGHGPGGRHRLPGDLRGAGTARACRGSSPSSSSFSTATSSSLTDEGGRVARARQLRSCGQQGLGLRHFGPLVGHLLLRTWERAERIHLAMLARGFTGEIPCPPPVAASAAAELAVPRSAGAPCSSSCACTTSPSCWDCS